MPIVDAEEDRILPLQLHLFSLKICSTNLQNQLKKLVLMFKLVFLALIWKWH
jgi:hypothetical protein